MKSSPHFLFSTNSPVGDVGNKMIAMKKVLALAAIASLLFSCSEKPDIDKLDSDRIPLNISVRIDWGRDGKDFLAGDEIGIYVVNYNASYPDVLKSKGNQADNVRFIYDGSDWNTNEEIFLKDDTSAACYAYYPYTSSIASPTEYPFSVQKDQSIKDNYDASNFLWRKDGIVVSREAYILTKSPLSRLQIVLQPGNGFTEDTWNAASKSVCILGVKISATIDLSTGIATATDNIGEVIPLATSEDKFEAIMIPQVVADNSKLIVINIDGIDYIYHSGAKFDEGGIAHSFVLTINKTDNTVEGWFV